MTVLNNIVSTNERSLDVRVPFVLASKKTKTLYLNKLDLKRLELNNNDISDPTLVLRMSTTKEEEKDKEEERQLGFTAKTYNDVQRMKIEK